MRLVETEGQPPYVHMLIDFSTTQVFSYTARMNETLEGYRTTEELVKLRERLVQNPLLGWVVSVGMKSEGLKAMSIVLANEGRYKQHNSDTLEDALLFLKSVDESLRGI